jgi:hypothetical protein
MINCIDNIAKDILLHVAIWFDIELVNLLLLSYTPKPMVRNGVSILPLTSSART